MNAEEIIASEEFAKCRSFHGHICPGLALGFVAGKSALKWIKERRAVDEEVVAIVENDSCFVDAIQVLTGCTFGKGNLIYKDYGKMAFTLLSRKAGTGVRLSLRPDAFAPDERHAALRQKIVQGEADEQERKLFQELHYQRTCQVLGTPGEKLFRFTEAKGGVPQKARIAPSQPCALCGEPTMESKLVELDAKRVCRACAGQ
ncbi:MAG: TraR/DksA C4-type zinc finger protein [Deltaproteobacteria bacterium]|nr:TraR/DksA C4-type zinc finger protein [Deltaproteobacteria bacterium]